MSSLFDLLAPETRVQIYRDLLVSPRTIRPSSRKKGFTGFDVSIFRVNKRIHDEAIAIFYEENVFAFFIKARILSWFEQDPGDDPDYKISNNLTVVPTASLKMIKRMFIDVVGRSDFLEDEDLYEPLLDESEVPFCRLFSEQWSIDLYRQYKFRLTEFAAALGGNLHNLRQLNVSFRQKSWVDDTLECRCIRDLQNVLEPLSLVYNVEYVTITGTTFDFWVQMMACLRSSIPLSKQRQPDFYSSPKIRISAFHDPAYLYLSNELSSSTSSFPRDSPPPFHCCWVCFIRETWNCRVVEEMMSEVYQLI